jgi:hypothetical protein
VARGAYVVALPGEAGDATRYTVEVEADAAVLAGARLAQARAELQPGDRRTTHTLLELGSSPSLPLQLLSEVGPARRELLWHNTLRSLVVGLVRLSELDADDAATAVESARAAGAEGTLLVAEPELAPPAGGAGGSRAASPGERRSQAGPPMDTEGAARHMAGVRGWSAELAATLVAATERLAVWVPAPFTPEGREVALELHARRLVLDAARAEGRTCAGDLVEFLERARAADAPRPQEDTRLAALRDEALALGHHLLALAAEDRAGEFAVAERSFRRAYTAAYSAAHDRFYGSPATRQAEAVRASGPYRALAALAALEAVAVPDDRVQLDRALAAAVPAPCTRRLDLELAWKPRCGCGFALGQGPPTLDPDALVAQAQRGVDQYLAELARPEHASRLSAAVDDLVGLGRTDVADDLRRLLALVAGAGAGTGGDAAGAGVDPLALAHLLTVPLASVVRDVLAGASLVVQRDLSVLREDLIGRRYPKRRLLELIGNWVDPTGEVPAGGFVEVVDHGTSTDAARISGEPGQVSVRRTCCTVRRCAPERPRSSRSGRNGSVLLGATRPFARTQVSPLRSR